MGAEDIRNGKKTRKGPAKSTSRTQSCIFQRRENCAVTKYQYLNMKNYQSVCPMRTGWKPGLGQVLGSGIFLL